MTRSGCGTWRAGKISPPLRSRGLESGPWRFSPNGTTLAWGSALGGVTLWDVGSREEVAYLEEGVRRWRFLQTGPPCFLLQEEARSRCGM